PSPAITAIRADAIAAFLQNFYSGITRRTDSFLLKRGEASRPGQRLNMVRPRKPGEDRLAGRRYAALVALFFSLAGFALVNGCASSTHAQGDPLVGEQKGTQPINPPTPPAKTSSITPPPMTPSGTNAALASLPGGRPLAIQEATWQRNTQSPPANV